MKLAKRYTTIELEGRYAGATFEVDDDVDVGLFDEFASGDIERILAALALITTKTNLVDADDQPIDVTTVAGWKKLPVGVIKAVPQKLLEIYAPPKATSSPSATTSSTTTPEASPASTQS